jgi:hypothetical protein
MRETLLDHLKLTFVADKPPPSHVFTEVVPDGRRGERGLFLIISLSRGAGGGFLDIAGQPAIVFHHNQKGRFIARSGHSLHREKRKILYITCSAS